MSGRKSCVIQYSHNFWEKTFLGKNTVHYDDLFIVFFIAIHMQQFHIGLFLVFIFDFFERMTTLMTWILIFFCRFCCVYILTEFHFLLLMKESCPFGTKIKLLDYNAINPFFSFLQHFKEENFSLSDLNEHSIDIIMHNRWN